MKLLRNITVALGQELDLKQAIARKLEISKDQIIEASVRKRSLDARKRNNLVWQYTALLELNCDNITHLDLLEYKKPKPDIFTERKIFDLHPFIIGAGPAGLFCALELVEKGLKPYIFEQGDKIEERDAKIKEYWHSGKLDPTSNIQFGEGGAGAYSDGKLTARNQDYYTERVFEQLVKFGAEPEITREAHPHLGTDKLKSIIISIREYLVNCGCRFFWKHKLQDIKLIDNRIEEVVINSEKYQPEILILAIGNSARSLFNLLRIKIPIECKPLAVGFRIEHEQDFINQLFYGEKTDISITGAAEYRIKANIEGTSVFSFCMCPGGSVVNSSSDLNEIVTNGMSYSQRNGRYSNSAVVTPLSNIDKTDPLSGMRFQQMVERKCFGFSEDYCAPGQRAADFLTGTITAKPINSTFLPGTINQNLNSIYPDKINQAIRGALNNWNKRFKGFAGQGYLIAPETRTSSPVRILRDQKSFNSLGAQNLYPIGEGSGYSSGIISSASDGIKIGKILKY